MASFNLSKAEEIKNKITESKAAVVVFSQKGCGACVMFEPTIEEAEKKFPALTIIKYNIREDLEFANESRIQATPTTFFYRDGKFLAQEVGYFRIERLEQILKTHKLID